MTKSNVFLLLFVVLGLSISHAQGDKPSATTLLEKGAAFFASQPSYTLNMKYRLYRDSIAKKEIEAYNGFYINTKDATYLKVHNTEFISTPQSALKINHDQKAMVVDARLGIDDTTSPVDFTKYIKLFATQKVVSDGQYWRCELTAPKYTSLQYGKLTLYFKKDTFQLYRQVMLMTAPAGFKDETGAFSRDLKYFELTIESFSNEIDNQQLVSAEKYIKKNKGVLTVTNGYKEYTIQNLSK